MFNPDLTHHQANRAKSNQSQAGIGGMLMVICWGELGRIEAESSFAGSKINVLKPWKGLSRACWCLLSLPLGHETGEPPIGQWPLTTGRSCHVRVQSSYCYLPTCPVLCCIIITNIITFFPEYPVCIVFALPAFCHCCFCVYRSFHPFTIPTIELPSTFGD